MLTLTSKNERLRAARIRAGFQSAAQAARRLGVPYGTYTGHENGLRGVKESELERYAKAFGVTIGWLLFGTEEVDLDKQLSGMFGTVGLSPQGEITNPMEGADRDLLQYPKINDRPSMWLIVAGPHARGFAESGWHIFADREFVNVGSQHIGKLCICKLDRGRFFLRLVQRGSSSGLYTLEGPLFEPMRDQRLIGVAEVSAIFPHRTVTEVSQANKEIYARVWEGVERDIS